MGYRCTLKSNKIITDLDVRNIVNELPEEHKGFMGGSRQTWGWSCVCDVKNPIANELDISGSYSISGEYASDFVQYFKEQLEQKGHTIELIWSW